MDHAAVNKFVDEMPKPAIWNNQQRCNKENWLYHSRQRYWKQNVTG